MRKRALMLVMTAATLACGTLAASAQTSGGAQTDIPQIPTIQATPGGSAVQQNDQVVRDVAPSEDTQSLTIQGTPSSSAPQQNDQVIRNVEPLQEEND
jgi:hypothetical protein